MKLASISSKKLANLFDGMYFIGASSLGAKMATTIVTKI